MEIIGEQAGSTGEAMRVLIADDQPDVLEALRLVLKNEGYQTLAVSSPQAILNAVETPGVDLVLMDLNYSRDTTSGREGLEVLSRIQQMAGAPPVVVLTAWGSVDLAVEAMRRGARDFVLKPWENERLIETLRERGAESERLAGERAAAEEEARRTAFEMERARKVQRELLPHAAPRASTLQCAGVCLQAGAVGGDFYDFLDLGPGRVAVALADASGKGVSAALLMAHLQASLRSQAALARTDARALLRSVNGLFQRSTAPGQFATLFFARYEDATRRLRWISCGHNPAILRRADGRIERLGATATVLGLIEEWDCVEAQTLLAPGDTLAIYSDGVTEARDDRGDEFGEERLVEALSASAGRAPAEIVEAVVGAVRAFDGGGEPQDDLTLLVCRGV